MAKKLANKKTKILLTEAEIKERRMNIGEFSGNWQGRVQILKPKESRVAEEMGFDEIGEYCIKVR